MDVKMKTMAVALAAVLLATPGFGVPTIVHEPIPVAAKGQSLGVRATVRDAAARVETVSLFYASSRGMTPFRATMASSGAGIWYATIPGHMIGPGAQLFYYVQAENADGETKETDWHAVKVVESGVAPAAIPAASAVAQQAQRDAVPVKTDSSAAAPPATGKAGKSKYLVPLAVIAGGAVAIGGAIAIADDNSGGGGGDDDADVNLDGNYGGTYQIDFLPTAVSNTLQVGDSGPANVYVAGSSVRIVGPWDTEIAATLSGQVFSTQRDMPATTMFPSAHLIVTGEIVDGTCTARIDGYSTDPLDTGTFGGELTATKR